MPQTLPESPDYQRGYADGKRDSNIIASPRDTNEHTFEAYQAISARYMAAINPFVADDYQIGYGAGFDAAAVENGYDEREAQSYEDNL